LVNLRVKPAMPDKPAKQEMAVWAARWEPPEPVDKEALESAARQATEAQRVRVAQVSVRMVKR
jgi:hypothetical protein